MHSYRIRNWRKFQHYKSGRGMPPWIKLHYEILRSPDWIGWSDSTKLSAICCMLVASMYDGCLPDDPLFVKRVCHIDWRVDFKPLIECGFIEKVLANASTILANASLETETEKRDKERKISGAKKARLVNLKQQRIATNGGSDPKADLYRRSGEVFGAKFNGKITQMLVALGDNVARVRALVEQSADKGDPRGYFCAALRNADQESGREAVR